MKKKFLAILFAATCVFAAIGCGETTETIESVVETISVSTETTETTVTEDVVTPLPSEVLLEALGTGAYAVYLEEGAFTTAEDGSTLLTAKIYDFERFDAEKMEALKADDKVLIYGEEIVITTVEKTEAGTLLINGGLDAGGYEFELDEAGRYFESGYSDLKAYYELGEVTLPVSAEFVYKDQSDLDIEGLSYTLEELTKEDSAIEYTFIPDNTTLYTVDGVATEMCKIYMP